jgi:hypothetical protein
MTSSDRQPSTSSPRELNRHQGALVHGTQTRRGRGMGRRGLSWPVLEALTAFFTVPPGTTPAGSAIAGTGRSAGGPVVLISETIRLHPVPRAYLGFSIESANLCDVAHLARTDPAFVQLFRDVAMFRVGGNTGDELASWSTRPARRHARGTAWWSPHRW